MFVSFLINVNLAKPSRSAHTVFTDGITSRAKGRKSARTLDPKGALSKQSTEYIFNDVNIKILTTGIGQELSVPVHSLPLAQIGDNIIQPRFTGRIRA